MEKHETQCPLSGIRHPQWGMVSIVWSDDAGAWYAQRHSDDRVTCEFRSRDECIARLDDPFPFGCDDQKA